MRYVNVNREGAWPHLRGSVAYALAAAIAVSLAVPEFALAYVDPSVVTYAVQAIAGVAVAISAVLGVALRKVRRRIFSLFGIDPEGRKEHDAGFERFGEEVPEGMQMSSEEALERATGLTKEELAKQAAESKSRRAHRGAAGKRARATRGQTAQDDPRRKGTAIKWPVRLLLSALVSLFTVGTLVIVAPLEIVAASSSDFFFTPGDIANAFIPMSVGVIAIVAVVLSLIPRKPFLYALAAVFALGVCFYVQAMAMNTGLPIADGKEVNWTKFDPIAMWTLAVWIAIFVVCLVLTYLRPAVARGVFTLGALALVIVQGAGVYALTTDSDFLDAKPESTKIVPTEEGMFDLAEENNVVVFVLDTFDTAYMESTLEQFPTILDGFTGFTWYKNSVGSVIPTRYAIPFLLTGVWPDTDKTWKDWRQTRYTESNYLGDIAKADYSIGIYSNEMGLGQTSDADVIDTVMGETLNVKYAGDIVELNEEGAFPVMIGCALYRDLPWVLKPRFQFNTPDVKAAMLVKPDEYEEGTTSYVYDDADYYKKLKKQGLSIEDRGTKGAFRFIHLMGAHEPFTINEWGDEVEGFTSREEQCAGALRMVDTYIVQLKKLGLYEDTAILVTADHGRWYETMTGITEPSSPIILYKPRQNADEAAEPLVQSYAPVSHEDIMPTVLQAAGMPTESYAGHALTDYDVVTTQPASSLGYDAYGYGYDLYGYGTYDAYGTGTAGTAADTATATATGATGATATSATDATTASGSTASGADADEGELDWQDPMRPRYYYALRQSPTTHKDFDSIEWCIRGYVMDFDNWEKTGFIFKILNRQASMLSTHEAVEGTGHDADIASSSSSADSVS